jgi:pectate lyase
MKTRTNFFGKIAIVAFFSLFVLNPGFSQTGGFANVSIGGTSVTVSSASALTDYISRSGQYTIYVSGTISLSGMNDVASNKAIIGVGTNARITGGGLDIDGASNVVVQNITFQGSSDDAINVQDGSTNVWINHCSFGSCSDGQVDIKRESDYVTVSWCHFYNHDHCCLLGHSNSYTDDIGHLRVTYHHNFFEGEGRNPRVRFSALCHVYNNYYNGCDYGVASTMDAEVLVEGNYFRNVDDPCLVGYGSSSDGDLVQRNNVFVNSGSPETSGSVPSPPYSYSLDNASSIPSIVSSGAGANGTTSGDSGDDDDPYISASASAGSGYVYLTWSIHNITNTGTEVYRDTDSDPNGRTRIASVGSSTSYTDTDITSGNTYYYWIKVKDSDGTFYNSDALQATPRSSSISTKSALGKQISDYEINYNVNLYPNPFTNSTKISFRLEEEQAVSLSIYNLSGKLIDKTEPTHYQSGMNELIYENYDLTSGLYNMTIHFKDKTENIMLMIK